MGDPDDDGDDANVSDHKRHLRTRRDGQSSSDVALAGSLISLELRKL